MPNEPKIISSHELRDRIAKEPPIPKMRLGKFAALDEMLDGLEPGELITIAALPGAGKSSLCVSFTKDLSEHYPCLWFSCEMSPRSFINFFGADVPLFYLPDEIKQFSYVQPTLEWLEKMIVKAKEEHGTKVVFLDHLQYLTNLASDRTVQMVDYIMRQLKEMTLRQDIIFFLVTHIDKDSSKDDKRPGLGSLRGSQMIAGESSIVLFIQRLKERAENAFGEHDYTNKSRISIEKNRRTGRMGHITLQYNTTDKIFSEI